MAWSILNTNAVSFNAFLVALRDFLTAHSWTTLVDGTGGGGETLEMTNANSLDFKLSKTTAARTDSFTGAFTDVLVNIAYQKSDVGATAGYHTAAVAWDFAPSYSNLWFITDGTTCHIIAQVSPSRYTHASFGEIDPKGLHAVRVPFCAGNSYVFWAQSTDYSSNEGYAANYPIVGDHNIGYFFEDNNSFHMGIPDGLLDPALGFTDGPIISPGVKGVCSRYYDDRSGSIYANRLLDYLSNVVNHTHTGGVNLAPIPVCVYATNNADHAYIGELPGIALVNMTGLSPSQVLTFGAEEWIVFPMKQTGTIGNSNTGATPQPDPNSIMYGFAWRKA